MNAPAVSLSMPAIYAAMIELAAAPTSEQDRLAFDIEMNSLDDAMMRRHGPRVALLAYADRGERDPYENRLDAEDYTQFLDAIGVTMYSLKIANIDTNLARDSWSTEQAIHMDIDSAFAALIYNALLRVHGVDLTVETPEVIFPEDDTFIAHLHTEQEAYASNIARHGKTLTTLLTNGSLYSQTRSGNQFSAAGLDRPMHTADRVESGIGVVAAALAPDMPHGDVVVRDMTATVRVHAQISGEKCEVCRDLEPCVFESAAAYGMSAAERADVIAAGILDIYTGIAGALSDAGWELEQP